MASIECMHAGPLISSVLYILLTVFGSKGGRYTHITRLLLLYTTYCHDKDMQLLHLSQERKGDTFSNLVLVSLKEALKISFVFLFLWISNVLIHFVICIIIIIFMT